MPYRDSEGKKVEKGEEATDVRTVTARNDGAEVTVTMAALITVNDVSASFVNPGNAGAGDGISDLNHDAGGQNQVGVTLVANGDDTDLDVEVEAEGY